MPLNKSVDYGLDLIKKDPSKILGLTVGKHEITEPGQYVPRADAQSPPQLTLTTPSTGAASTHYTIISLDLDAPFPSFPKLGPILHWVQSGLTSSLSSSGALTIDTPFIADYIGPAPPPLSAPHRYAFFLYQGEVGNDLVTKYAPPGGQHFGNGGRLWASLDEWEGKLGLRREDMVAVNYFYSN